QRQATKDAGAIAGLEVVRIINEPTAAALAYGLNKLEQEMRIMVFDLGGGTLDVTLMEFGQGVFEVKATSGDTQLGGTDMDRALVDYIVDSFKGQTGIDLRKDASAMNRVREAAERAKIELSSTTETEINLPYITYDQSGPKNLYMRINRATLEQIVAPIVERCRQPVMQALQDAKLRPEDVDKIILVGGPTRMPVVQDFIKRIMGKEPERGVDPMECVAMGAAIQGAILAGELKDKEIVLLDVVPISLGVETLGGIFTKIIDRNTTIPVKRSEIFTTAADFQTSVEIHVLQGERPMAADNVSLGRFSLTGIPPAPRGVPKIEVTFDINADGILTVTAKDLGTGKDVSVKITAPHRLSKEEVDRMIREAEAFAEQDRRRKQEAELRNEADSLVYTVEKALAEFGDKAPQDVRREVEEDLKALKESLQGKDIQAIKSSLEKLRKSAQKIGGAIYGQAGEAGGKREGGEDKGR
ncbi:MAG: molecular chaperone DnaK, partial [Nitrososphaerota archaeon]